LGAEAFEVHDASCLVLRLNAMSDNEEDDIQRIKKLMAEALAKDADRSRAIHEAGHAIVALHLGLPLESVNIEERDEPDGPKFGCVKVRAISDSFSVNELEQRSPRAIERARKQVIMLLAGETATKLILERASDPLAQIDQSGDRFRNDARRFRSRGTRYSQSRPTTSGARPRRAVRSHQQLNN
jgi:hypothetical protein